MLATVTLYGTLALAVACVAFVVRKYDLYDREPWWTLLITVIAGAGFMYGAGWMQRWLIGLAVERAHELVGNAFFAVLAGVTEEAAKIAAVLMVMIVARRHFNDPIDGLIYGAFAGLGAAIEESIYVLGLPGAAMFLPMQEPVRLAGHLVMGGIGGFGMGFLVLGRSWWPLAAAGCLSAAVAVHTLWDVVAFAAADRVRDMGSQGPLLTAGSVGVMAMGFVLFRWFVHHGAAHSRRKFAAPRPSP